MNITQLHYSIISLWVLSFFLVILAMWMGSELSKDSWLVAIHIACIWSVYQSFPNKPCL